jgi:hypothetical protein
MNHNGRNTEADENITINVVINGEIGITHFDDRVLTGI